MAILKYRDFSLGKKHNIKESEEEQAYSFDELSSEAQAKAIDYFREDEDLIYEDWYDAVVSDFEDELRKCGIDHIDCQFSGFYSQGDGASFTGEVTDNRLFIEECLGIKALRPEVYEALHIEIKRDQSSRYVHENTIDVVVTVEGDDNELEFPVSADFSIIIDLDKEAEKIEDLGTTWARKKSSELYRELEREYDYLRSDENIENFIVSNDYEFDEEGNLL